MIGLKIAKDGSTVADNSQNQYVDTDTPLFKRYMTGSGVANFNNQTFSGASPYIITIPHNLGYWPMAFLYMDRASNAARKFVTNVDTSFPENTILVLSSMDNKNIYLSVTGSGITGSFGYNYEVFYDKVGADGV